MDRRGGGTGCGDTHRLVALPSKDPKGLRDPWGLPDAAIDPAVRTACHVANSGVMG
jgi:hypothetical protein